MEKTSSKHHFRALSRQSSLNHQGGIWTQEIFRWTFSPWKIFSFHWTPSEPFTSRVDSLITNCGCSWDIFSWWYWWKLAGLIDKKILGSAPGYLQQKPKQIFNQHFKIKSDGYLTRLLDLVKNIHFIQFLKFWNCHI